jgi:hypothetical protein
MNAIGRSVLVAAALTGVASVARAQTSTFPAVSIAGSRLTSAGVTQVADLFEYRYVATNPSSSNAGVESVLLDVSAPLGQHPDMLLSHGVFLLDGTREAAAPSAGHVPIGVDVPGAWDALIFADGFLVWGAPSEGIHSLDAIPPGGARDGFVVRSPRLPGLRTFSVLPDYPYVCCPFAAGDPRNESIVVRTQEDFRVDGVTIGPVYEPAAVTFDVVAGQVQAVCAQGWINSAGVCNSLQAKLRTARAASDRNDIAGARAALQDFLTELDAQHGTEPGKHVTDNAYFLLKINVETLLGRL